jgi:hypothetical protein
MPLGLVNFVWQMSQGTLLSGAGIVSSGLHVIIDIHLPPN